MNNLVFTDGAQQETVEGQREFYIGGSELNQLFDDFYKGDIIRNIFDKICYERRDEGAAQPEWAVFGHQAEDILRDFINRTMKRNYKPAVAVYDEHQCRTNVDGYDEEAIEQLWECKTYSGKENIEKYRKQIVYYLLRNNVPSLLLTTFNKDVLDENGKKIRNITIEEMTDKEITKRVKNHIIYLKDNEVLVKHIENLTEQYIMLYTYISTSNLMKQFIKDYRVMIGNEKDSISEFMKNFE